MGYSTSFALSVVADEPTRQAIDQFLEDDHENAQQYEVDGINGEWFPEGRWYNSETDMITLSEVFPDALFILQGEGEESLDVWEEHYKGGQVVHTENAESSIRRYKELLILCKDIFPSIVTPSQRDAALKVLENKLTEYGELS